MVTRSRFGAEVRTTLFLAIPLAAAQLAQSATGFVDTLMMGLLGSDALAAGGLGAITFTFLLIVATGVISAVSPLAAEAYGAGNSETVTRVVRQGLWLSTLLAIPLTLLMLQPAPLLGLLGQDPTTIALTERYLTAIAWGYFPGLGFVVLRSFVTALSQPRPVMVIVILGTLLNVGANYTLMFGKFGFPSLGLAGIGWASTFSLWSMFIALVAYILRQPALRQYAVFQQLQQFELKTFRELVRVGVPIGGMIAVEGGLFTITTFLMGQIGTIPLAAHQVALQSAAIAFNVPLGISFASTVRVGQLFGKQDFSGARLAGFIGIGLSGLSMALTALLFWTVPERVVALYLDVNNPANREVVTLAKTLLGVAAIFQLADGIQAGAVGALRGLQDTRVPLVIAIVSYWCVGLVSSVLFGRLLGFGAVGLWWGLALGLAVAAVVLPWRFDRYTKQLQQQPFTRDR